MQDDEKTFTRAKKWGSGGKHADIYAHAYPIRGKHLAAFQRKIGFRHF